VEETLEILLRLSACWAFVAAENVTRSIIIEEMTGSFVLKDDNNGPILLRH
jgi:hypothetical protein